MNKTLRKQFLRTCLYPWLWFVCRGVYPCPQCESINGTISGYSGANGKTHGWPDYAPAKIEHHFCLQRKHDWTRRYCMFPDWYYSIRTLPARLMSNKAYHELLDKIDYSVPVKSKAYSR